MHFRTRRTRNAVRLVSSIVNMCAMNSDAEAIKNLEWRLKRLENFIGQSHKKPIMETINGLNEKVMQYADTNVTANKLMKKVDVIRHLTSSEFQRSLTKDQLTKLELILADEERIRSITASLTEIDTLAKVLDGQYFQEIPKLYKTLDKLLTNHNDMKNQHSEFTQELSSFLQDYAAFTMLMDENLAQYKTILHRTEQNQSSIEDNPVQ